nr:ATP-binding cassette domain-containing protein [Massilimicrobiota sp. An134]
MVGSNGSGKSTLFKIVSTLLESTTGLIKVNGYTLDEINIKELRKKIGLVNQNPIIFNGTLLENLTLNDEVSKETFEKSICISCLDSLIRELPMGLETNISQSGMNLSGGQKQKIALARVLMKKPELLLLDEPTASLDNISEKIIMNNIKSLDIACIVISHRLSTIQYFDRIIVLDKGEILEEGTHEELMSNKKSYYNMFSNEINNISSK